MELRATSDSPAAQQLVAKRRRLVVLLRMAELEARRRRLS
jgi:hypothetical protein